MVFVSCTGLESLQTVVLDWYVTNCCSLCAYIKCIYLITQDVSVDKLKKRADRFGVAVAPVLAKVQEMLCAEGVHVAIAAYCLLQNLNRSNRMRESVVAWSALGRSLHPQNLR